MEPRVVTSHPDVPEILLASASPRRKMLLETLGYAVRVAPVDVDETERPGESAPHYLVRIVDAKLAAARAREANAALILVADTTVDVDGVILHKPVDREDGRRMLRALSARAHVTTTRFAMVAKHGEKVAMHAESVPTRVIFRALVDDEIDAYVESGEGDGKAGGYAIQGRAAAFVSRIEGSYGAIVGLPSCEVSLALRRLVSRVAEHTA